MEIIAPSIYVATVRSHSMVTSPIVFFLPPRRKGGEDVAVIPGAVIVLVLLYGGQFFHFHGVHLSGHYELSSPTASDGAITDLMARRGRIFYLQDIYEVSTSRFIYFFDCAQICLFYTLRFIGCGGMDALIRYELIAPIEARYVGINGRSVQDTVVFVRASDFLAMDSYL